MIDKPLTCQGCPLYERPYGTTKGFSVPDGKGNKGVLIVAEALGESELNLGIPLVGKAGHYLSQQLGRRGMDLREDFTMFNCVACRPPNNKLAGMSYEAAAVRHCAPNLDQVIEKCRKQAKDQGQHFTILTLGKTAFKRILGEQVRELLLHKPRVEYRCYPFWSDDYQCWVVAADHPSYLMRGNGHLVPVLQFAAERAIEIAKNGLVYARPTYLEDPDPATFAIWVDHCLLALSQNPNLYLVFDIETPYKQKEDEEKISKEEDDDYTILRISFSYQENEAVSVPWRAEYMPYIEELFLRAGLLAAHNANYDVPRVRAQVPISGIILDSMVAWHVLNSALPKSLGFIAPFYCQDIGVWKQESKNRPAFYNCADSDITLRCLNGIMRDLHKTSLGKVFDRHVVELNKALNYMSKMGVLRDEEYRKEAENKLSGLLDDIELKMEGAVPQKARKLKVYKKVPKNVDPEAEGWTKVEQEVEKWSCPKCGALDVVAKHFASVGKKKLKAGLEENPCLGLKKAKVSVSSTLWAKPESFKVSKLGLSNYQKALKHQAILSRKEKKVTFDKQAILRLRRKYPNDPLYPLITDHRKVQKLLSTYVGVTDDLGLVHGGLKTWEDGRIHTLFSHNPNTLRLASQDPNLQNLPRPTDELAALIRNLVVAQDGSVFHARDYSGIEALLVGYFASSRRYMRLCRIDVHSFYTAYGLYELDHKISAHDLPDLSWSDDKLRDHLAGIKKEFKKERNNLYKHLIHGANFYQGARGAKDKIFEETEIEYPEADIRRLMDIYFELFPEIKKWHWNMWFQVEKDGYLRNPFGYVLRFANPISYEWEHGKWEKKPGTDANKICAFLPQSTAAGIIKEAILRLFFDRFEEAGQYMRLQVHDEILSEVPEDRLEAFDLILKEEMERPIPELALSPSFNMGKFLHVDTEPKTGKRWGSMK